MTLTKQQLRRAAKEARKLAMIRLTRGYMGSGTYRDISDGAGLDPYAGPGLILNAFEAACGVAMRDVPSGLDYAQASVFPLLATADYLDAQARGAP